MRSVTAPPNGSCRRASRSQAASGLTVSTTHAASETARSGGAGAAPRRAPASRHLASARTHGVQTAPTAFSREIVEEIEAVGGASQRPTTTPRRRPISPRDESRRAAASTAVRHHLAPDLRPEEAGAAKSVNEQDRPAQDTPDDVCSSISATVLSGSADRALAVGHHGDAEDVRPAIRCAIYLSTHYRVQHGVAAAGAVDHAPSSRVGERFAQLSATAGAGAAAGGVEAAPRGVHRAVTAHLTLALEGRRRPTLRCSACRGSPTFSRGMSSRLFQRSARSRAVLFDLHLHAPHSDTGFFGSTPAPSRPSAGIDRSSAMSSTKRQP